VSELPNLQTDLPSAFDRDAFGKAPVDELRANGSLDARMPEHADLFKGDVPQPDGCLLS